MHDRRPRVPQLREGVRPGPLPAAGQALPRADELGDVRARRPPGSAAQAIQEMLKEFFGLSVCRHGGEPVQVADGPVLPAVLQEAARQDPLRQGPAHRRDGGEAADGERVRLGARDRRGGRVPVPADAGGGLPARACSRTSGACWCRTSTRPTTPSPARSRSA